MKKINWERVKTAFKENFFVLLGFFASEDRWIHNKRNIKIDKWDKLDKK